MSGARVVANGEPAIPWADVPGVPWRQALRSAPRVRRDMLGVVSERYDSLGPVVRQSQGPMKMVNLFGPDATRMLLLDRDGIFSAKKSWDMIMGRIFTNGLLLRDGEDHRYHRRLLREAFRTPALMKACTRYFGQIKSKDKSTVRMLCEMLTGPQPADVDDPSNPPASYWVARWKTWSIVRRDVMWSLEQITGQKFYAEDSERAGDSAKALKYVRDHGKRLGIK